MAPSEIAPPRTVEQRTKDVRIRLEQEVDAWVATANPETGNPYLVVLSLLWDGEAVLLSTAASSPTGRNLKATGVVTFGLGQTRDVVLVEGTVESTPATEIPNDVGDAFAAKTGFDPRESTSPYLYFHVRPQRIQAWREVNEQSGRVIIRDGVWLAG